MKQQIIMMRGLPGSGKTTAAKALLKEHPNQFKRINKDDLRAMLDNGKWSKENEEFVLEIRDTLILAAFGQGYSVIVDDTNLDPKHEARLREIIEVYNDVNTFQNDKKTNPYSVVVKDFTHISIEECIRRNRTRRNKCPTGVIVSMYNRYLRRVDEPKLKVEDFNDIVSKFEFDERLPDAVQFDLDGTLALFGDNNPYDRNCLYDKLNLPVFDELRLHQKNGDKIVILSGRKGEYLKDTDQWLTMNGIAPDLFLMRAVGDKRPDTIVKREMFLNHVAPNYNVRCVYDDRDGIVDTWRDLGLTCFQVAAGIF
jgi:predicted kinase